MKAFLVSSILIIAAFAVVFSAFAIGTSPHRAPYVQTVDFSTTARTDTVQNRYPLTLTVTWTGSAAADSLKCVGIASTGAIYTVVLRNMTTGDDDSIITRTAPVQNYVVKSVKPDNLFLVHPDSTLKPNSAAQVEWR